MTYLEKIEYELARAEQKHPNWPVDDLLHQVAILNEESGEATRAVLHIVEGKGNLKDFEKEVIQTAAMCLRILNNLPK